MTSREKHVERLRRVRQSGDVNMFTDLKNGLQMHYNPAKADETFEWVVENWEFYISGEWVDRPGDD